MFWLILIMSTASFDGGVSLMKVEQYQYMEQCEYAGESFVLSAEQHQAHRANRYGYACVPAATNNKFATDKLMKELKEKKQ